MRSNLSGGLALLIMGLFFPPAPASAQVLIWSVPKEDGAWVRFEGAYKQTRARPNSNAGDEVLEWRSELTISAVGTETTDFDARDGKNGKQVRCRWIEFKALTKPNGLEKQPGPGDTFVYKVLIPEDRVIGKAVDAQNIPVTFLPIVKGWRKVGGRDVDPVAEKALAVYPTIALVTYYPDLKPEGDAEKLVIGGAEVSARLFKGTRLLRKTTSRSVNSGALWLSDDVPFGLARFQIALVQEQKDINASDDEFKRTSLIEVDMSVVATGNDGHSELGESQ